MVSSEGGWPKKLVTQNQPNRYLLLKYNDCDLWLGFCLPLTILARLRSKWSTYLNPSHPSSDSAIKMKLTLSLFLITGSLFTVANASLRGTAGANANMMATVEKNEVECRVTVNTMMEEVGSGPSARLHEVVCLPINENGVETDGVFPIVLPKEVIEEHKKAIHSGRLYLKIRGAAHVEDESLTVADDAEFDVYGSDEETLPNHLRRLEQGRKLQAKTGTRTIAVVRIKTADNKVTQWSASQLEKGLFGNGVNSDGITFANQYKLCSDGKLTLKLKEPVIEIKLTKNLNQYTVDSMQIEVQKTIKQARGIGSLTQLADNTMFIMPEGMGFTASAPVNHWRSSYHNLWGLSLAGTMHELGHNLGLGHAWEDNAAYQDYSGYMAAGGTATNEPQTCFNGFNMNALGWFNDKTTSINTAKIGKNTAELYKVSAFVDYDRAKTYEPVLLNINNAEFVLQYNRKSRHNIGTREKGNLLTVTEAEPKGQAASNMIRGLDVGQEMARNSRQGQRMVIKVCKKVSGNGSSPDALIVSVGNNADACNREWKPPVDEGNSFVLNMAVTETAPRTTAI